MKKPLPELARAELDVLKVLWTDGKRNAREIHDALSDTYDWAYSTTRTTVERMVRKGLLTKREFHGIFLYAPAISRPQGLAHMVRDFAQRVLEVDATRVVALFAGSEALDANELEELQRLIDSSDEPTAETRR